MRITCDDGATGIGQVSTYNSDITSTVLHRQVAPWVLDVEFEDIDALTDKVIEREHKFPGSYMKRALGGLDTAIWDCRGKQAGLPVVSLLGGTPGPLRAYASSMRRDITPAAEAERLKRLQGEFGFDAFKFRVAAEYGHDVDEWPGRTEEIVPTIRRALGDGAALLVDANSGFSPARAIEVGRMLEDHGVEHFEEPCLYWELEQTKEVADALDDRSDRRRAGLRDPDLAAHDRDARGRHRSTGHPLSRRHQPHASRLPHGEGGGPAGHAAQRQSRAGDAVHDALAESDRRRWKISRILDRGSGLLSLAGGPVRQIALSRWRTARLRVSDAPGWGVEIDPEWLAKSSYRTSEMN